MILEKYNIHFHRFSESTFEIGITIIVRRSFQVFSFFFSISQTILPKARSIDNGHRSNPLLDQTHQPLSTNIRPCFSAITSNFSILNKPILRSPVPHTFTLNFDRPHRGNHHFRHHWIVSSASIVSSRLAFLRSARIHGKQHFPTSYSRWNKSLQNCRHASR